ncbi:MAG: molecular chaperone DnaK [Candidatus Bipolaricaulia bacterium]
MAKEKIIGIDLGTTNSCAAIIEGGESEVIPNAEGGRVTPSVVSFTDGEILVGEVAKRQAITNPNRTVRSIKRHMGEDYPVKVDGNKYAPEEISAHILGKIKRDAEAYLGGKIDKVVITVPAYFNDNQRQATKNAGKIAGLQVERIINEPTAASLAYGLDKDEDQTILVFDLGGGTFDVSILDIGEGVFEVVATHGDTHLGGDDFDDRVIDWLVEQFKNKEGIDLKQDPNAMQRLKEAAEAAKKELSSKKETAIHLPYITADQSGPKHLEEKLTRAKFEQMITDYLDRTMKIMDQVLQDAKMTEDDIDQIVLVGGSTRMPKVQEMLIERFSESKINKGINPDEVVAVGAAIQAGILAGEVDDIVLLDVTPLTLSIETLGGIATPLIERNTTIPTERTNTFTTAEDGQTTVDIHAVQGERKMAANNRSLGRFQLTGILPAPRGIPQIDVTFKIDVNGILQVEAKDKATGKSQSITIKETSRLTEEEIERMRQEAEEHEEEDKLKAEEVETRNQADQLIYATEKSLNEHGEVLSDDERNEIRAKIDQLQEMLDRDADVADLRRGIEELSEVSYRLAEEMYKQASESQANGEDTGAEAEAEAEPEGQKKDKDDGDDYIEAEYED